MSSSASVRSGWGLVVVCGLVMFLLGLYLVHQSVSKPGPYLSVSQSYWSLHVESEGSVVPLVRLTIFGSVDRVHK